MHISYADLAWITSQINTLISNTRSYVASSPFRGRQIEAIVSQLEVVIMPLFGARTKDQLLKRLTSKWGAEEDEPATKVAKRPSADPSVLKRPANETVLKRPSAKRPASAMEEDEAGEENQVKQRDRNKDGWLKRNLKSLPEGVVATIEQATPGKRTEITNAIVEKAATVVGSSTSSIRPFKKS